MLIFIRQGWKYYAYDKRGYDRAAYIMNNTYSYIYITVTVSVTVCGPHLNTSIDDASAEGNTSH